MKKKKKNSKAGRIQARFDTFVKRTIKNIIDDVLRSYMEDADNLCTVNIEDFEDIAAPEDTPDFEKIKVALGTSSIYVENELLAAGLDQLSDKHRRILECVHVLDMPTKAIAELLELKAKTICNYKYEAYGIIRKYMEDKCDV